MSKQSRTDEKAEVQTLPQDSFRGILLFLPIQDVQSFALTNKSMNTLIKPEHFWRDLLARDFPGIESEQDFFAAYKAMTQRVVFGTLRLNKIWTHFDLPNRPCAGTYDFYKWDEIPTINRKFSGDFKWLLPTFDQEHKAVIDELEKEMKAVFPQDLKTFLSSSQLQHAVSSRSPTGCFTFVPKQYDGMVTHLAPNLVEFYRDSQSCCIWYAYFENKDGKITNTAVLSSYLGIEEIETLPKDEYVQQINWCGGTVESFLYRIQLENNTWFNNVEKVAHSKEELEYLQFYTDNKDRIAENHKSMFGW